MLKLLEGKTSSQGSLETKFYDNFTFRTKRQSAGEALTQEFSTWTVCKGIGI